MTWNDLANPSRQTVWQHIRSLRHQPPGFASGGHRRKVFGSALEQAEELFRAAEVTGYASQPILLFYGLSQAGRAIAAASTSATGNDWRLAGHGIKVRNLAQGTPLSEIVVSDDGSGSFTQLAPLLGSGSLPTGSSLGELWATIPDLHKTPVPGRGEEYRNVLRMEAVKSGDGEVRAVIYGLPLRFAYSVPEEEIASYLAAYPSLVGSTGPSSSDSTPTVGGAEATAHVPRRWTMPANDLAGFKVARTWPYRGDDERYVYPALGGSDTPLYPLLTWWAILFALSMLARYEPASWTTHLDVDSSPDAVPLEAALSEALDACPQLILHAIRAASR